jgi:PAS domain S-box-containing protein
MIPIELPISFEENSARGGDREDFEELKDLYRELQLRQLELEAQNRELLESKQKLESGQGWLELFEEAPVGYLEIDEKGFIRRVNQTGAAYLGRTPADLLGKPFVRFIRTRDIHKFVVHMRECFEFAGRRNVELRVRVKGNESMAVLLWSEAIPGAVKGEAICRTTLTDITERKRAEEALHESKECFRIMTETAPVLVWMSGTNKEWTYCNQSWLGFTGRTLMQEMGEGWMEVVHPEDRERCLETYYQAFDAREQFNFEFRLRRHDQAYRWFLNTGIPRFTPAGQFAGYIGSCVDITERKEAEEMRRQLLEDFEVLVQERTANLKAANNKLRQEISTRKRLEKQIVEVADCEKRRIGNDLHDGLGQQLTGVAFLSKVLEQKLTAKKAPERAEASQVYALVSAALRHTRELARGLHVVELQASGFITALQELRDQVESVFNVCCQLKCDKSVRINNPTVATHLYRITQEAVNNAIKHGKTESISISLAKADRRIILTIKDAGVGCPKLLQEKSGMGLHTMKYRTEMIQGTFDIQSGPEGGTVVTCSFPAKVQQ